MTPLTLSIPLDEGDARVRDKAEEQDDHAYAVNSCAAGGNLLDWVKSPAVVLISYLMLDALVSNQHA
jgi:hypothetical protein